MGWISSIANYEKSPKGGFLWFMESGAIYGSMD